MDTDALVEQSRTRFAHEAARRVLREKYQAKMTFAYNGGMWRAGPELLTLLACAVDGEVVLLDLYGVPTKVKVDELESLAHERWQEQMQAWLVEHQALSRER